MRLAATEIGLKLNHGVAARSRDAFNTTYKQPFEAVRQIGTAEELRRLAILVSPFADVYLPEIRREFRLLILPAGDIHVRRDDFSPRLERARRRCLDQRSTSAMLL